MRNLLAAAFALVIPIAVLASGEHRQTTPFRSTSRLSAAVFLCWARERSPSQSQHWRGFPASGLRL
ncbi:hypothetical protein [Caldimonas sp.]|jgi:hypothetical protein|uniref:hypothetical protein n=1 Tax=Caldimonas sp. TaxID=2838790 RepID=UPI00391C7862